MSKHSVKIDSLMELSRVISTLEEVLASLKRGALHISLGDDAVTLVPPPVVDFELELEEKKDKAKMSLEISWRKDKRTLPPEMTIGPGPRIG